MMGRDQPEESTAENMQPNSGTKVVSQSCNYWWLLASVSLLIGAAGFITVGLLEMLREKEVYVYGIVFDAGSSHTNMYIYKWTGAKTNGTAEVKQIEVCKTTALSKFESHPLDAGSALIQCLNKAKEWIPSEDHANTEIYLGATAGMRLLNESNPTISDTILYVVREEIKNYPFEFLDAEKQVRIISGEEEGTYSWITVNYFAGTLGVKPLLEMSAPLPITHGALDMGGASTQMTFSVDKPASLPKKYKNQLRLYGINHTVYTNSYLCFGINEATRRFEAHLVKDQGYPTNTTILNPCGPKGHTEIIPHDEVFEAPCTKGPHAIQAFGSEIIPTSDVDANLNYSFVGESDPDECQIQTQRLFNFTQTCPYTRCSFNGVYQPAVVGDFYAFSSFFYQMQFLNLTGENVTFALEEVINAVDVLCNSSWDEVKTMKTSFPKALPWYCFQTTFVLTLLTQGYGFNSTNWNSILFKEKVNNADLGWALGFMIESSNKIPPVYPEQPLSVLAMVLLLILFFIFTLAAIGFAYYAVKLRKPEPNQGYERINTYGAV